MNNQSRCTRAAKQQGNATVTSTKWSEEEIRMLELCLMKYGTGQWAPIEKSGLLPGKTTNQLYNQTQRLLGQQSLAAYSGLCVDIARIRKDNAAKIDMDWQWMSLGNLSVEEKSKKRAEAAREYGLTQVQRRQIDEEIESLVEQIQPDQKETIGDLLYGEVGDMKREDKLSLLVRLRSELKILAVSVDRKRPQIELPISKKPRLESNTKLCLSEEDEEDCQVDEKALKSLIDMGYSDRHSIDALTETNNDVQAAAQWLLFNCS